MQQRPFRNVIEAKIQADFEERQNATDHLDSWLFDPQRPGEKLNSQDTGKKHKCTVQHNVEGIDPVDLLHDHDLPFCFA